MNNHLRTGDECQVKTATHDGYVWIDATVSHVDFRNVTAVLTSGRRVTEPHVTGVIRPKPMSGRIVDSLKGMVAE